MMHVSHIRPMKVIGVLGGLLLLLSACTGDTASSTTAPGDVTTTAGESPATTDADTQTSTTAASQGSVVVVGTPESIRSFDPAIGIQGRDLNIYQQIYDILAVQKADGSIEPSLATSWTISDDGLTYTFNLRENVVFSNGEPLEADDVVYTFQRAIDQGVPLVRARWENVASVTEVDTLTVEFQLSEYDAGFFLNITNPLMIANPILNREATEAADPSLAPVGTGPFIVESYSPGSEMVLSKNDNYWKDGSPKVDRLVIRTIPVQTSQVSALEAGEIDIMFPTAATALTLEGNDSVSLVGVASAETIGIQVNSGSAPLDDPNVRRAISLAINRQEVVDLAFFGGGVSAAGTVSPAYEWAYLPGELPYTEYDPAEAVRLLTEAGYADGFDIELMTRAGHEIWGPLVEVVAAQLQAVGINSTILNEETGVWLERFVSGDFQITNHHFVYGPDPFQYVRVRQDRSGPMPPELADLEAAAVAEPDPEARIAILRQIQEFQADLVYPNIGIVAPNLWVAFGSGVENVNFDFTGGWTFLAEVEASD